VLAGATIVAGLAIAAAGLRALGLLFDCAERALALQEQAFDAENPSIELHDGARRLRMTSGPRVANNNQPPFALRNEA
jgi:hypothetical protein